MNQAERRSHKIMQSFSGMDSVVGVEVGVFAAALSSTILPLYPNLKLWGVDPFKCFVRREHWPQERWDDLYNQVVAVMKQYGDRWKLLRMDTFEAAEIVPNNLDFVYLDDDHSYNHLIQEIPVWEPKVRKGGMLSGHDYNTACPDVIRAVREYACDHGRALFTDESTSMWWWFV